MPIQKRRLSPDFGVGQKVQILKIFNILFRFESLAVSWLFPGKTVKIEAPCLDCGARISIEMKDGSIQKAEPDGLIGYTSVPFRDWFNNLPYA